MVLPIEVQSQTPQVFVDKAFEERIGPGKKVIIQPYGVNKLTKFELFCVIGLQLQYLVLDFMGRSQMQEYFKITCKQRQSFIAIHLKETIDEVLNSWRQMRYTAFSVFFLFVILDQFRLGLPFPGKFFGSNIVEKHSESKGVSFSRISVVTDGLNRHVQR